MSIRYRLKRNSGSVQNPIPIHPDAIYRPQNRPTSPHIPPVEPIVPKMANNPVAAAPLAASAGGGGGNSGSSPWWIIGPLLALLAAMALATLAYTMKKKRDQRKQNKDPNSKEKSGRALDKLDDPGKEHVENLSARARERSTDNASLRIIETETKLGEHGDPVPMANLGKDGAPSLSHHSRIESPHQSTSTSDRRRRSDEKGLLGTGLDPTSDAMLIAPLKSIRSVSVHTAASNLTNRSGRDDKQPSSDARLRHQEDSKQHSGIQKPPTDKAISQSTMDRSKTHQLTKDGSDATRSHSPDRHGIGQSPLISTIPSGGKRSERTKSITRRDPNEKSDALSNADLLQKTRSSSTLHRDGQGSTLLPRQASDSLSPSHGTDSSISVASATAADERNSQSSKSNGKLGGKPSEKRSDLLLDRSGEDKVKRIDLSAGHDRRPVPVGAERTKSDGLIRSNLSLSGQAMLSLPNVPQCKTSTSSGDDEDDYDEVYSITASNTTDRRISSTRQKTSLSDSNTNTNASSRRERSNFRADRVASNEFRQR